MIKKYCTYAGWFLFVTGILAVGVERGYSDDLYKASLTSSSSLSYSKEVEAKINIEDNGKVELSIKGLRSYSDNELVSQDSVLVIETEINESPKTYSKSFTITDGEAEEEFTLEDLSKDDKLEITSVVINKVISITPTPTVTASPTPTGASTAAALRLNASTDTSETILVPGGIISESTTVATPTPVTSPSPTVTASPTSSPAVIEAEISIKPETINVKSRGKFKTFITLPSPYSVTNINVDTVECEGAQAIDGKVANNRFIATFRVQDLGFDIKFHKGRKDKKVEVTLDVTGELKDGTKFKGSDTVKIQGKEHNDDDDNDDHGKKKHD